MPRIAPAAPSPSPPAAERAGERITVALIRDVTASLAALQERTSLSKTDLANRAITLYEFVSGQLRAGNDLLVRDRETGETQLVRFL